MIGHPRAPRAHEARGRSGGGFELFRPFVIYQNFSMPILSSACMAKYRVWGLGYSLAAAIAFLGFAVGIVRAQPVKGYDVTYYNAPVKLDRLTDSLWGQGTMSATVQDSILGILQYEKYLVIDSVC